jgi:hypothetical protein
LHRRLVLLLEQADLDAALAVVVVDVVLGIGMAQPGPVGSHD